MKEEIPVSKANRLVNHGSVVLVTSQFKEKSNIITLAWQMPVSHKPMLIAISIAKSHYSHDMVKGSGEFAVNVPNVNLLSQVHYCGTTSGRDTDKFAQSGLTPLPAQKINPPLIAECIGHIECRLFDGCWKLDEPRAKSLHHLGGNLYTTPDTILEAD